tara:strand:- start:396 stop:632 length:237 start_codon:yes stop_codon:yes gene_type:complete
MKVIETDFAGVVVMEPDAFGDCFVKTLQNRQGLYVAWLEETGFKKSGISQSDLYEKAALLGKTGQCVYLKALADNTIL